MIGVERWLDVLSLLVIVGIIGAVLSSMRRRGVRTRSLSEKPALFLEFTGKQVSVRRKRSRILPSYREQADARTTPTIAGFKDAFLKTRHDSIRVLSEGWKRGLFLITTTGRQTRVTAARAFVALRTRLDVANRARDAGVLYRSVSGGVRERLTSIRQRLAGASSPRLEALRRQVRTAPSWQQTVKRVRQGTTDVLLYIDYGWYRLERSVRAQSQQFKAVKSRFAKTPFKELPMVRVLLMKRPNTFAAQARLQSWLGRASSVMLQHKKDLATGCRALQAAARAHVRRLSETKKQQPTRPQRIKPAKPISRGAGEFTPTEPVVLSLTSSGTLKLKSRLEDERTTIAQKSAPGMSAPSKGASSLSQVSVRYVGALQRRYGDPAESKQAKQVVK
jgi:hypothetical protein